MAGEPPLPEPELTPPQAAVRRAAREVAVLASTYGLQHARTATARVRLATALRLAGNLAGAEEEAARAFAVLEAADLPDRDRAATELGLIRLERGNREGAVLLLGAAWERERAQRGLGLESCRAEIYYASALGAAGRFGEAIEHQEQAAEALAAAVGQEHPETGAARLGLAELFAASGRRRDAIGVAGDVVAAHERVLGADHVATLTAGVTLAGMLTRAGEPTAGRRQLTRLHERLTALAGPDDPLTLDAATELAVAQTAEGDLGAAVRTAFDVGEARARSFGLAHPQTLRAYRVAAELARPVDLRFAVTIGVQTAALAIQGLGLDHDETRKALEALRVTQEPGPEGFVPELLVMSERWQDARRFADVDYRETALAAVEELVERVNVRVPGALAPEAEARGPLRRTAHARIEATGAIEPGRSFAIVAWTDDEETGHEEVAVTVEPAEGADVVELEAWLVVSRHFTVEGPAIRTITIDRRHPRSDDLSFAVRAVHPARSFAEPPEARIVFSADGWPSGTLALEIPLQEREEVPA